MFDDDVALFEAGCLAGNPTYCGFCLKPGFCPEVNGSSVESCASQITCLSPNGSLEIVAEVRILLLLLLLLLFVVVCCCCCCCCCCLLLLFVVVVCCCTLLLILNLDLVLSNQVNVTLGELCEISLLLHIHGCGILARSLGSWWYVYVAYKICLFLCKSTGHWIYSTL